MTNHDADALIEELTGELRDIIPRFETCCRVSGTADEYIEIGTRRRLSEEQTMSETRFTPGFWQTRKVAFEPDDWERLRPNGSKATTITQQFGADVIAIVWGDDDENTEANAHLLTAAPDIYEALQDLLADYRDAYGPDEEPSCMKAAEAALRKARGEQP